MGFFADGREEALEEAEERALEAEFKAEHLSSKIYMKVTRWLPKILTFCTLLLIVFVYGVVVFRAQTSKAPKAFRSFQWDDHAKAVYSADPGNFTLFSQAQQSDIDEKRTDAGYSFVFATSDVKIAPAAGQLQITVRYNQSIEKQLLGEFMLTELPAGEWFTFVLVDQDGKVYHDCTVRAGERNVNQFRCLTFRGLTFTHDTQFTLMAYYVQDMAKEKLLFDITAYDAQLPLEAEKVTFPG